MSTSTQTHQQAPVPPSRGSRSSAPAIRRERRLPLVAGAIALIAVAGIGGGALVVSAGNTHPVVAITTTVTRGDVIQRSDLRVVDVGGGQNLRTVDGDQLNSVVGKRAATDLPAGTLLPQGAATSDLVPHQGRTLVGLQLKPSQLPATTLQTGDTVRLVTLPTDQSGAVSRTGTAGAPIAATVVGSQPGPDNQTTRVDVEVPSDVAAGLSVDAATGRVALILDSRER
ncbi:SAF domain-containing protein [Kribbella sp. NPDC059898]|uniref:SAF domain-containing protein n=1 Tax=Kribbella sp. NPDC059898 TaxID=3346995 RepID=UPI003651BEC7